MLLLSELTCLEPDDRSLSTSVLVAASPLSMFEVGQAAEVHHETACL